MAVSSPTSGCPRYRSQNADPCARYSYTLVISPLTDLILRWLGAIEALARLSSLKPDELGLSDFAAQTPYFPRQVKSLSAVSKAQAQACDDSGKMIGPIPEFNSMIRYFTSNFPDESRTGTRIVHGDYKIDNLIFHPTRPVVIGILDWELCTVSLYNPVHRHLVSSAWD